VPRSRSTARQAGARCERVVADYLAAQIADDRIELTQSDSHFETNSIEPDAPKARRRLLLQPAAERWGWIAITVTLGYAATFFAAARASPVGNVQGVAGTGAIL